MNTAANQVSQIRHLPGRDQYSQYVLDLPAFWLWWRTVDHLLQDYAGRSAAELPIPDRTWRLWWQSGQAAQRVADLLAFHLECVA